MAIYFSSEKKSNFRTTATNFTLTRGGDCMNENIEKNELDEYIELIQKLGYALSNV